MIRKIFIGGCFLVSMLGNGQQKNTLLSGDFWKKNPSLSMIQEEIAKGNDPSAMNPSAFDPVTMAINNGLPNEVVLYLLEQKGNDVHKITHDARTYLHWAANKGNVALVEELIKRGSNIHLKDSHDSTPLIFGILNGQTSVSMIEVFEKAGLDLKQKYVEKGGANLLLLAIANDKKMETTNFLISKGLRLQDKDDAGNTTFDYASRTGNIENLKYLRSKGVLATKSALLFAAEATRRTSNGLDVFKYLIEELNINSNSVSENGMSALHFLSKKENQKNIVEYLLSKGAKITLADKEGNTALHLAAAGNDLEMVKYLLEKGSNLEAKNNKSETILMQAVKSGSVEMLQLLIEKGASVLAKDKKGANMLHLLVQNAKEGKKAKEILEQKIQILLNKGIVASEKMLDGNNLWHLATAKNDLELVQLISTLGADILASNNEGFTALHKAALLAKNTDILKFLIEKGANKSGKTAMDETAYDLAKDNEVLQKNQVNIDFLK